MVVISMIVSSVGVMPAFAADGDTMTVTFTDITSQDTTVLQGETKIKVSVDGAPSNVSIMQLYLDFSGDFEYKSIQYLCDTDDVTVISPNTASSNVEKSVKLSLIDINAGMDFSNGPVDLFVLTFSGEAGDSMTLSLNDLDNTYYIAGSINNSEVNPTETTSVTAVGSTTSNSGVEAVVRLTMDKVTSFSAALSSGGYVSSGIELTITDESDSSYKYYTVLNNTAISLGGHRDATSTIPVFEVSTELVSGHTYTVTLNGIGYVSATQSGVDFSSAVEFTNDDLIPGDVTGDGEVDQDDYDAFENVLENVATDSSLESLATDFNRDGTTDAYDENILLSVYTPSSSSGGSSSDSSSSGSSSSGSSSGGSSSGSSSGGTSSGSSSGGSRSGSTPTTTTTTRSR